MSETEPVYLYDVSGWNPVGGIDHAAARRDGFVGAIIKASQGETATSSATKHAGRALNDGQVIGGYHFADPRGKGMDRPREQCDCFVRSLESMGAAERGCLVPWLDMEWISFAKSPELGKVFRSQFSSARVMDWTDDFAERMVELLGVLPVLYTGRSYVKYRYKHNARLARYHLALAAYVDVGPDRTGVPKTEPAPIELDDEWTWPASIHQFTGKGRRPWYRGGKGKIDLDVVPGGQRMLSQLTIGGN